MRKDLWVNSRQCMAGIRVGRFWPFGLFFRHLWHVMGREGRQCAKCICSCVIIGFGIKKKRRRKCCYLHLCMYLLLSVINCIFNIVVSVWLSASSDSFQSPVNLPKTPRYRDEQKVYFRSFYHQKHWHLSELMFSPFVPIWRHSEIHLCAFARPANQMAERNRRPITAQDLHHSSTNGEAARERSSSHRSPQCCSQPATSQLTCLLRVKYGWNDGTRKQVGLFFRERPLCCSLPLLFFFAFTFFFVIFISRALPAWLCLQTCNKHTQEAS